MNAIAIREAELKAIEQVLWGSCPGSVKAVISDVREFAIERLQQIREFSTLKRRLQGSNSQST